MLHRFSLSSDSTNSNDYVTAKTKQILLTTITTAGTTPQLSYYKLHQNLAQIFNSSTLLQSVVFLAILAILHSHDRCQNS